MFDFSEKTKQINQRDQSVYNLHTNHPLQINSQNYFNYKKYVSIHSEDRDINKYPLASSFEIELPEPLLNVAQVTLTNWSFPVNYSTFTVNNNNITMTFQINQPYNPGAHNYFNPLQEKVFEALFNHINQDFVIQIEEGFYNPIQMTTELTNKFNEAVTIYISNYFLDKNYVTELDQFRSANGYQKFVIVYNTVKQNIWYGNICDGFVLTNETQLIANNLNANILCTNKGQLPDFSSWGLPSNLGLPRNNVDSISIEGYIPRFYYGDVNPGDNGFWLLIDTSLPGSSVYYIQSPYKINLMGNSYIYVEIAGLNCIDETVPYNLSKFTETTNETNGIVNSAFAKIALPATPISQIYDRDSLPYKLFLPPAERIKKLSIKIRYHNGQLVNFDTFNYSFLLEFTILLPAPNKSYTIQSYNSTSKL